MLLREITDYQFVHGNAGKAILENLNESRFEIWVKAGHHDEGALAWVFYETVMWLKFDRVATEQEVSSRKYY